MTFLAVALLVFACRAQQELPPETLLPAKIKAKVAENLWPAVRFFIDLGDTELEGQDAQRYDYSVPQMAGAYPLRSAEGAAVVGYHGSFWVAERQVDPVRINVIADDIPTDIGFSAATSVLDSDTSAGGDPFQATLVDDMKLNDGSLVPKGAIVSGRIAHITKNGAAYLLDFVVTSIVFDGGRVELSGRQNSISVENWSKIRQSARLNLQRGAHLRLQSIQGKPAK